MKKIAIILFAFRRPHYLRRAIRTHKKVEGLDYFAFINYSEMQKKIYEIIDEANIYTTIFKRPENLGLNESIKRGIQDVFNLGYDAVIVLEDDLLLDWKALSFLTTGLYMFEDIKNCGAISCDKGNWADWGFKCWAWATWKDRWEKIDWSLIPNKKNRDSWDVIIDENFRQKHLYTNCPTSNLVKHIGWQGVHYSYLDLFSVRRLWKKLF